MDIRAICPSLGAGVATQGEAAAVAHRLHLFD